MPVWLMYLAVTVGVLYVMMAALVWAAGRKRPAPKAEQSLTDWLESREQPDGWADVLSLLPKQASDFKFYDDTPIYYELLAAGWRRNHPVLFETWGRTDS